MIDPKKKVYICRMCGEITYSSNGNQPLFCSKCNATSIFLQSRPQVITKETDDVRSS